MPTNATDNQRMASEPVMKAEGTDNVRFDSEPNKVRPSMNAPAAYARKSIRQQITFNDRKFDVKTLPIDMQRVVGHLTKDFGEEYALTFAFMVRTASELHRAWHMTLLTHKVLQQIKDKHYAAEFADKRCSFVLAVGVAFWKKELATAHERLV